MNLPLKMQSDINVLDIDVVQADRSTKDIIKEYQAITIKLSLLAESVPETGEEQEEFIEQEISLLDLRAGLLETALLRPVVSLDGAEAILALWHHEVVQSQTASSLSAADELVNSVFSYFQNR